MYQDSIATFDAPDLVLIGSNVPHYWHGLQDSSGYAIQFNFEEAHQFWHVAETAGLERLWADASRGIQFSGASAEKAAQHVVEMAKCGGVERLGLFILALGALDRAPETERRTISRKVFVPSRRQSTYRGYETPYAWSWMSSTNSFALPMSSLTPA